MQLGARGLQPAQRQRGGLRHNRHVRRRHPARHRLVRDRAGSDSDGHASGNGGVALSARVYRSDLAGRARVRQREPRGGPVRARRSGRDLNDRDNAGRGDVLRLRRAAGRGVRPVRLGVHAVGRGRLGVQRRIRARGRRGSGCACAERCGRGRRHAARGTRVVRLFRTGRDARWAAPGR